MAAIFGQFPANFRFSGALRVGHMDSSQRLRARAATGVGIPKFNWHTNYIFSNLVFLKGVKVPKFFCKTSTTSKAEEKNCIFQKSNFNAHFCIFWE